MKSRTIIVSILIASVLAVGCASPDTRSSSNEERHGAGRTNQNYYAVIESIEPRSPVGDSDANDSTSAYRIRVRFDDKSYRTVTQASIDGLRIGDSVRIERGRVRHY